MIFYSAGPRDGSPDAASRRPARELRIPLGSCQLGAAKAGKRYEILDELVSLHSVSRGCDSRAR